MTHSGRGVHRIQPTRRYTASEEKIGFWRRYLELVFAHLFDLRPPEGRWCEVGAADFKRSIAVRNTEATSAFLADSNAHHIVDEATWHCARFLTTLYHTESFHVLATDASPSLMAISDDQYWMLAGFAHGVGPHAVGRLSLGTWDSVLQDLANSVWVDFLAWCAAQSKLGAPARDLVLPAVAAFSARSAAPDQQADDAWFDTKLCSGLRTTLAKPIGTVSRSELDELLEAVLAEYPNDRVQRLARYRPFRDEIMEDALGVALDGVDFPFDEWAGEYLAQASTRANVETRASVALLDLLIQREYEVAVALRGALPEPLVALEHRLEITSRAPETRRKRTREGAVYAYVRGISACGSQEAIARAQRSAELFLAAPAVRFSLGVRIELAGENYFRIAGSPEWLISTERHGLPLGAVVEQWSTTLETWANLLRADDPLALRIHDAIVSMNKGNSADNSTDRLQAHWRVFEILVGDAGRLRSWGYLLPLYFVPKSFFDMSSHDKRTFVVDRSNALRRQFQGLTNFRNTAIDHREIARPDNSVLDYWATTGAGLAREALSAAIAAWHQGERTREVLERRLRNAYDRLGVPLD